MVQAHIHYDPGISTTAFVDNVDGFLFLPARRLVVDLFEDNVSRAHLTANLSDYRIVKDLNASTLCGTDG